MIGALGTRILKIGSLVAAAGFALSLAGSGPGAALAPVSSGDRNVFVPITGCRLFDTRPATPVGTKHTKLGAGQKMTVTVRGASGKCNIPTNATAVALTLAYVSPSAASGLRAFAPDRPEPSRIDLRFSGGQASRSAAVTVGLSADGKIAIRNLAGTVDVIGDLTGFYAPHNHDDRYYLKATADKRFFEGSTLVLVRADGTAAANGITLHQAVAAISDASASKPYTVRLAPGVYDVGADGIDVPAFVDLAGSGQDRSIITAPGTTHTNPFTETFGTVRLAPDSALRDATVQNTGGASTTAVAIEAVSGTVRISDVTVRVSGGNAGNGNFGITAEPLSIETDVTLSRVTVTANAGSAIGDLASGGFSLLEVHDSTLNVTGGGGGITITTNFAGTPGIHVDDTDITVTGGGAGLTAHNATQNYILEGDRISVSGGTSALGLGSGGSAFQPVIRNSTIVVSGGSSKNTGYSCTASCSVQVQNSRIAVSGTAAVAFALGTTGGSGTALVDGSKVSASTIVNSLDAATIFKAGGSQLAGTTIVNGAGTFVCVASYKTDYTALTSTCT
jgi:hypothetical protein